MKKLLTLLVFCFPLTLAAQYYEIGGFLGASNYNGDFTEDGIFMKESHWTTGALFRYNFSKWVSIKANLYKGTISGTDQNANKYYHRRWTRNLHFKSEILDIGIQPEINLRGFSTRKFSYKRSPYFFVGVSMFKFSPMAEYDGKWVALQPLGTEGQYLNRFKDRRYNLTQIAIPIGFGYKVSLGQNLNAGIELSARKTFTDYLDDVSNTYVDLDDLMLRNGDIAAKLSNRTGEAGEFIDYPEEENIPRGSPKAKDWYYFAGFTLTYSILPRGCIKY